MLPNQIYWHKNVEQAYLTTEILVGIGFIVSIVFLAVQMRQNSYLLRKQMADQRQDQVSWLHETIVTDYEFRKRAIG